MGRLLAKPRLRAALVGLGLLCAALALIAWPAQSAAAVREGMALCANVVIPSLFPFFVLASLVVELGLSRCLGRLLHPIMAPLFRVNGACAAALALGFVGGYPVGARTAIQLYQQGQCSKTEAERLLAFCNNSGPAFILGAVGAGVFGSGRAGLALYLCHMAASLMVGLLFRFYRPGEGPSSPRRMGERFQAVSFSAAFPRSVTGAMTSSLNICAFILCFSVVVRLLTLSGLLGAAAQLLSSLPLPWRCPRRGPGGCWWGRWSCPPGCIPSPTAVSPGGCLWPPLCWAGRGCPSTSRCWPFWGTAACLCAPISPASCSTAGCPPC